MPRNSNARDRRRAKQYRADQRRRLVALQQAEAHRETFPVVPSMVHGVAPTRYVATDALDLGLVDVLGRPQAAWR